MANKIVRYFGTGVIFTLVLLSACSAGGGSNGSASEIDAARIEGRIAARKILTRSWRDTGELVTKIEEARSLRARYDSLGHRQAAEAFDSSIQRQQELTHPNSSVRIRCSSRDVSADRKT